MGGGTLTSEGNAMRQHHLSRRGLLATAPSLLIAVGCAQAARAEEIVVYKTPWCGCCKAWVTHMAQAGFRPIVREMQDLAPVREQYGIPFVLSSCHTGVIGGYVIEGHVPAEDILRLLAERPKGIRGIAVPGMPRGSPGMEQSSGVVDDFTVIAFDANGAQSDYNYHNGNS